MEITMMRRPVILFFLSFILHLASADLSSDGGLVKDGFPNPVPDYAFGLDGRSLGSRQRVCPTPGPGARLCDADTKCADGRYATRARIIQTQFLTFSVLLAAVVNVVYVVMAPPTVERGTALAAVKPWLCVVLMATSR